MPLYGFRCENGHQKELYASIKAEIGAQGCGQCGLLMERIIYAPIMVTAQQECRYDSPITGEIITSWAARRNDLAKHNCIPYDEGMRIDYTNRLKAEDQAMDATIEAHVEETIEKMPTKQRNALASDILDKGQGLEYARGTPHA